MRKVAGGDKGDTGQFYVSLERLGGGQQGQQDEGPRAGANGPHRFPLFCGHSSPSGSNGGLRRNRPACRGCCQRSEGRRRHQHPGHPHGAEQRSRGCLLRGGHTPPGKVKGCHAQRRAGPGRSQDKKGRRPLSCDSQGQNGGGGGGGGGRFRR